MKVRLADVGRSAAGRARVSRRARSLGAVGATREHIRAPPDERGAAGRPWTNGRSRSSAREWRRALRGSLRGSRSGWGSASWSALLMGSSRGARRTLGPMTELLRATPVIAILPVAIARRRSRGRDEREPHRVRGVLPRPRQHDRRRAQPCPPRRRDTASMLHVGPRGARLPHLSPSALPSIVAGAADRDLHRTRSRRHLRVRRARETASGATSSAKQAQFAAAGGVGRHPLPRASRIRC